MWIWVLAAVAAFMYAGQAAAAGSGDSANVPQQGKSGYPEVRAQARKYAQARGWNEATSRWWENFAQVQAFTESRGNLRPYEYEPRNTTTSEAAAAGRAYDAAAKKGWYPATRAAYPRRDWDWGSGGWYGLLPAYGLEAYKWTEKDITGRPLSPYDIFDAWRSTVMMHAFAQRVIANRFGKIPASERNAYALKRGFAAGSLVAKPDADRSKKSAANLDKAMTKLGIPKQWALQPVPAAIGQSANYAAITNAGELEYTSA